jgi:transcriptional regulator with GAF, ATPase, and Fis domain
VVCKESPYICLNKQQQNITTMTLSQLQTEKANLLNTVNELVAIKKRLYSNMDIEQPMSKEEKDLNAQIAKLYSQVNKVVKQIRGIK